MLTSKPLAAAIAGLLFACAGAAAAEGHVKIFMGYDPAAIAGAQPGAATVKSVPLTPLDDPRLAKDLSAGKPPPSAAWFAKFDGVDGSSKNDAPAARPLRSTSGGESYLEIEMQDTFVSSYQVGGRAKSPTEGGPRKLSAGEGGGTAMFDMFAKNLGSIHGESESGGGVHRAAPVQQLPPSVAPQRSPIADGARNAAVVGEKLPRSAPAAPSVRR